MFGDRRLILKAAVAAMACAGSLSARSTVTPDPLIALISEYRAGMAAFNARAGGEPWEGLTEETYAPSFDRLRWAPPQPTTFAGAMAGIEFVLSEMAAFIDSDANEAVLRVCADFLRQHSGAMA